MTKTSSLFLLAAALLARGPALRAAGPIRVMLLDGQSGGPYHAWQLTTPVLNKELEETGLFRVDVVTAPPSGGDFSHFKPDFKQYAVVVSNLDSPEWPAGLMASSARPSWRTSGRPAGWPGSRRLAWTWGT